MGKSAHVFAFALPDFILKERKTKMENIETEQQTEEQQAAEQREKAKKFYDPDEQIRRYGKGKLTLKTPILADGKDVTELEYDFTALTGMEFVSAIDRGMDGGNSGFRIAATQAFNLFAAAADKATRGIDATDIRRGMSAEDSVKAVQLATVFFVASSRAGDKRISAE